MNIYGDVEAFEKQISDHYAALLADHIDTLESHYKDAKKQFDEKLKAKKLHLTTSLKKEEQRLLAQFEHDVACKKRFEVDSLLTIIFEDFEAQAMKQSRFVSSKAYKDFVARQIGSSGVIYASSKSIVPSSFKGTVKLFPKNSSQLGIIWESSQVSLDLTLAGLLSMNKSKIHEQLQQLVK